MSNDTARELLIVGLRNAHAMERQAEQLIQRQLSRTEDYPEVRTRLSQHLEETQEQTARLEECLEQLGVSRSMLKDSALAMAANFAAMGHAMAGDEILKNTFANNAFENYEIAAYKSLIALAKRAGVNIAQVLGRSLQEEERMAQWIESQVENITVEYLEVEEHEAA